MKRPLLIIVGLSLCSLLEPQPVAAQALRTDSGNLWANTTLNLQAIAYGANNAPIAVSQNCTATIRQKGEVQVEIESEAAQTIRVAGWYSFLVTNKGNGEDTVSYVMQKIDNYFDSRWLIDLYEQQGPDQIYDLATRITTTSSLMNPDETRRFFVRLRAPNDTRTDGLTLAMNAASVFNPQSRRGWNFYAGADMNVSFSSRVTLWTDHRLYVPPVFFGSQLFWIAYFPPLNRSIIFGTNQPLRESGTLQNNVRQYGNVGGGVVGRKGVLAEEGWYLNTEVAGVSTGMLRVDMPSITEGVYWSHISNLNNLVRPDTQPATDGTRVFIAGLDNRLYGLDWLFNILQLYLTPQNTFAHAPVVGVNRVLASYTNGQVAAVDLNDHSVQLISPPVTQPPTFQPTVDTLRENVCITFENQMFVYDTASSAMRWQRTLPSNIATQPTYDQGTDCYYFATRDSHIYALQAANGNLINLYPRRIFENTQITEGTVSVVATKERKVPYVYLLCRTQENGSPQTRFVMITAANPLNRLYDWTLPNDALFGGGPMLVNLPSTNNGFILPWFYEIGSLGNEGAIYAYRLR